MTDPDIGQHAGQDRVGAAVERTARDDLVTRPQQRDERAVDRRHAGAGDVRALRPLELGQCRFERRMGRIRIARVRVPGTPELEQLLELAGAADLERAGLVDRHGEWRLRRVWDAAGTANCPRREARHAGESSRGDRADRQ